MYSMLCDLIVPRPRAASECSHSRLSLCMQAHVLFERSNVCTQARILLFQLCAFSLCSAAKQALLTLASTGSRIVEASFSSSCDFIALYSSLLPVHLVAGPVCRMCFRMRVAPAPLFHGQKRIALHIRVDVVALAHTGHTFPLQSALRSAVARSLGALYAGDFWITFGFCPTTACLAVLVRLDVVWVRHM